MDHAFGAAQTNLAAIALAQDEVVDPASLEVGAPDILPGHPFYFVKNLSRGFRSVFSFSAEKKSELKLKFANEKIVEAQLLLERGQKDRAADHLKSYEKDLVRAKDKADEGKFIKQTFKHQAILDKIEKEVSEEKRAVVEEIREKTIEYIAEIVTNNKDSEKLGEALLSVTEEDGSAFKPLRNLEVLKAIEEKVPQQAKEAIRAAQENSVKRFKNGYEKSTDEEKEALADYIKGAGGDASRYLEAFEENKEALGTELSQKLLSAGEEKKSAPAPASDTQKSIIPSSSSKPSSSPKNAAKPSGSTDSAAKSPDATQDKSADTDAQTADSADSAESSGGQQDSSPTDDGAKAYEGSPPLLY